MTDGKHAINTIAAKKTLISLTRNDFVSFAFMKKIPPLFFLIFPAGRASALVQFLHRKAAPSAVSPHNVLASHLHTLRYGFFRRCAADFNRAAAASQFFDREPLRSSSLYKKHFEMSMEAGEYQKKYTLLKRFHPIFQDVFPFEFIFYPQIKWHKK